MKVVEKLRLNSFVPVSIPRNRDLYARIGGRIPSLGTGGFTSEIGKSKLDLLADSEASLIGEMTKKNSMTPEDYDQYLKSKV